MSSHVTCSNVKRDQGLALEYYRSYNLSWYDTTQYTATVRQARLNPFERPKKSNRKSAPFCFRLAVALVKFTLFLHRCVFDVTSMMWNFQHSNCKYQIMLGSFLFLRWTWQSWRLALRFVAKHCLGCLVCWFFPQLLSDNTKGLYRSLLL